MPIVVMRRVRPSARLILDNHVKNKKPQICFIVGLMVYLSDTVGLKIEGKNQVKGHKPQKAHLHPLKLGMCVCNMKTIRLKDF